MASAGRLLRLLAISRNTWLPVSAHECADSATIEADPEMIAAMVLATATHMFAVNATITVRKLSPVRFDAVVSVTTSE
jgi:hypothetical protein